ncbi:unnamed protein product [Spirodela intermedia]|uniref:Uncharacterized protein n=2 Tax=Spirodela intermedia TaxID=51605 RepID=A0A7I8K9E9_SPIIN|nr:unnamed protein product [Spirodela intermedia]CAA6658206.1 unnamed protein product [Spirodela intermedia]CAA7394387.1 unnamed protein product [Spirodela intermedia]
MRWKKKSDSSLYESTYELTQRTGYLKSDCCEFKMERKKKKDAMAATWGNELEASSKFEEENTNLCSVEQEYEDEDRM